MASRIQQRSCERALLPRSRRAATETSPSGSEHPRQVPFKNGSAIVAVAVDSIEKKASQLPTYSPPSISPPWATTVVGVSAAFCYHLLPSAQGGKVFQSPEVPAKSSSAKSNNCCSEFYGFLISLPAEDFHPDPAFLPPTSPIIAPVFK